MPSLPAPARDLVLALAVTALALALRWPYLQDIPRLTDETAEVATALAIAGSGARPLTHTDAYNGPAWPYLLAGAITLLGPRPGLPREFALVLGALTAGAAFLLGRAVADRRAGLIAGLVVATAFGPLALWSHVAWSNHSTPLWVTLAALLTWLGRDGGRTGDGALIASGALWGLALHSHPSALAPLLGAGLWWLASNERRARFRHPAPWLAALAFLLVMSPVIAYNLTVPLTSVTEAGAAGQPLALPDSAGELARRWIGLAGQLGRSTGAGPLAEAGDPTPGPWVAATDTLRPVMSGLYALVLLAALGWSAWRGPRYLAWLAGAGLLVIPFLNRNYESLYDQRYIGFLVPLAAVALGAWLSAAWARDGRNRRVVLAVALAVFTLYPLVAVGTYYQRELAAGRTNAELRAVVGRLATVSGAGRFVFVDKTLADFDFGGGGDPARAFVQELTLAEVPNERTEVAELRYHLASEPAGDTWVVAAPETAVALGAQFGLWPWEAGDGWVVLGRDAPGNGE